MPLHIIKRKVQEVCAKKYQIVWWWEKPTFHIWDYPRTFKKPMFRGYVFGIFEIRVWNKPPYEQGEIEDSYEPLL